MLGSLGDKLCLCDWIDRRNRTKIDNRLQRCLRALYEKKITDVQVEAIQQLDEYFRHERTTFDVRYCWQVRNFSKECGRH